jgi:diguanylate cyclase (GGDEF)-like protein
VIASELYPPIVRRIVDAIDAGAINESLSISTQALTQANERDAAILLSFSATALVIRGDALNGLRMGDAAHRHAVRTQIPVLVADAKLALVLALQALDKHALAIDIATDCERVGRNQNDRELIARSWRALGISMSVLGRHAIAIDYLTRAVDLLRKHCYARTRFLHARYSLLSAQSRALFVEKKSPERDAKFADLHDDWEDFANSAALENNARLHAMSIGMAASAARRASRFERALEQFKLALVLQTKLELKAHYAMTECHMGALLGEMNRIDDAIAAYERGFAQFHDENPRTFANALEEYSLLLEKTGRVVDALRALRRSRQIERDLGDSAGHAAVSRIERDNEISTLSKKWVRMAEEDALTGLPNRRSFDYRLTELIADATRSDPIALAFIDVDHFKHINDRFGHDAGDRVLQELGRILRRVTESAGFSARVGGEEFALLFSRAEATRALEITEAAIATIREHRWQEIAPELVVTASAGFITSNELPEYFGGLDETSLLRGADARLYRAKQTGRDRVCASD